MRSILFFSFLSLGFLLSQCQNPESSETSQDSLAKDEVGSEVQDMSPSEEIIQASIEAYGGEAFADMDLRFDFRERHYKLHHQDGKYVYERIFEVDTLGKVRDVLSNEGFYREVEGAKVTLEPEKSEAYANSVNGVMYFTLLPYNLNSPAVQSTYIGLDTIKGQVYHEIEVRFAAEGGGKDHQDVYLYWFHQEKNTLDFLAYSYEVNEGGIRFREARDRQEIAGRTFQNYHNFKAPIGTPLKDLDQLWVEGKLEKVSEIINENIQVQ